MSTAIGAAVGPLTSGPHVFAAHQARISDPDCVEAAQIEWVVLETRRGQASAGEVEVRRQGLLGDQAWGVAAYLISDHGALPPVEARMWAHAILAAANYAEQLEQGAQEPPC